VSAASQEAAQQRPRFQLRARPPADHLRPARVSPPLPASRCLRARGRRAGPGGSDLRQLISCDEQRIASERRSPRRSNAHLRRSGFVGLPRAGVAQARQHELTGRTEPERTTWQQRQDTREKERSRERRARRRPVARPPGNVRPVNSARLPWSVSAALRRYSIRRSTPGARER
jgi:hypothetical protein